ncbi:MAG: SLBB domain-containing protein [Steroidobacteraceae bacterium]
MSKSMLTRLCLCLWWLSGGSLAFADDYKVGSGDLLKVSVFDHPELSGELRVSTTGYIALPLVGTVEVAGLSTQETEMLLAAKLEKKEVLRNAQVAVIVTEYLSQRVSVLGQVAKPGQYSLTEQRTVMDMLALAGGVTASIAADEASLTHADGTRSTIDLRRLFEGDLSINQVVTAGDTLFVPRSPQFYIYGEVQRPGVYRLERDMSLSQAIAAGGGLTAKGTERGIRIKRKDESGKEQILSPKRAGNLRGDDVVLVKESLF